MLTPEICQKARVARDARFDGTFFTAVKTTGIYCRPICRVKTPHENNVSYYPSALAAANAGYRPCLRCRPDSAPGSSAWKGTGTTLERAIRCIDEGALQNGGSITALAERLGISDRYLRRLFEEQLGVSPKVYALHQQCLFAKQLLHQTHLSITEIALASGFNSIRRFNDCFQNHLKLTPSQIRSANEPDSGALTVKLHYRPPYNWSHLQAFLHKRAIATLEWVDAQSYGRTFSWNGCKGSFTAHHRAEAHCFDVSIELTALQHLKPVINNIRRLLDLDADARTIEFQMNQSLPVDTPLPVIGLRLPGNWNLFEAGVRAIFGQQISEVAARKLVAQLIAICGEHYGDNKVFPTPQNIADSELTELKPPASRKQTLLRFVEHYLTHSSPDDTKQWLTLKGIGPWTVDYARMRGLSDPDIFLAGDLVVKKAMAGISLQPDLAAPWRSYLTLQLWNMQSCISTQ